MMSSKRNGFCRDKLATDPIPLSHYPKWLERKRQQFVDYTQSYQNGTMDQGSYDSLCNRLIHIIQSTKVEK